MKIFLSSLLALSSLVSFSQKAKEFYTHSGEKTDSANSFYYSIGTKESIYFGDRKIEKLVDTVTSYYTETGKIKSKTFVDSNGKRSGSYMDYYLDGSKKEKGTYKEDRKEGLSEAWYQNGKRRFEIYFAGEGPFDGFNPEYFGIINYWNANGYQIVKNGSGYCLCKFLIGATEKGNEITEQGKVVEGLKDSTWNVFRNDTLIYTEIYIEGKLIRGVNFLDSPQEYKYSLFSEPPEFNGGYEAMMDFIKTNMRYPVEARRQGHQGTVFVSFVVSKNGTLKDVKILRGVAPSLNDEAIRVVSLMSGKWLPGKMRGKPVFVRFNLPLKFRLN